MKKALYEERRFENFIESKEKISEINKKNKFSTLKSV